MLTVITSGDVANSITADSSNNLYIGGSFYSSSFTIGTTTLTKTGTTTYDMFVAKLGYSGKPVRQTGRQAGFLWMIVRSQEWWWQGCKLVSMSDH